MAYAYDREKAGELLRKAETMATTIHAIALAVFGEALYADGGVDPLEIYAVLDDEFHAQLTEEGENRLNAIMMAVSTL